tara:strand:+ start:35679 stop:36695 length:1017 start_codon:yes stop_codon:yes gene_type:complete
MDWQERILPSGEVPDAYDAGAEGVVFDETENEKFLEYVEVSGNSSSGETVAHSHGFAGEFQGKLVVPFLHVVEKYPSAWPGPPQRRGDCVSHCARSAMLGSLTLESVLGLPDEVSGRVEEAPDVSSEAEAQGVLATESHYWWRGKNSDGWFIGAAAKVILSKSGAVLRRNYPTIGVDLTRYSAETAGRWGAKSPPESVREATNDNLFRTATQLDDVEEWRDFLGKGFFIGSDGSEGFSRSRDANGVARRKGSWSHSMAVIGYDDRPETHRLYGCAAALILNSWGKFNTGPRRIHGTDIKIPEGSFWALTKDFNRRAVAFSGANGWHRKSLPDLSPGFK